MEGQGQVRKKALDLARTRLRTVYNEHNVSQWHALILWETVIGQQPGVTRVGCGTNVVRQCNRTTLKITVFVLTYFHLHVKINPDTCRQWYSQKARLVFCLEHYYPMSGC